MPDLFLIVPFFMIITMIFTTIGMPLATKLFGNGALFVAPAIGLIVYSSLLYFVYYFFSFNLLLSYIFALLAAAVFIIHKKRMRFNFLDTSVLLKLSIVLLLSALIASCLLIKSGDIGFAIATPILDSGGKVAITNSMALSGLPAVNPFIGGADSTLSYYYLYPLIAASFVTLFPISAWNATIILHLFVVFSSICLLYGILIETNEKFLKFKRFSFFMLCVISGNIFTSVQLISFNYFSNNVLRSGIHFLENFVVQASWVPHHLFSASALFLAIFLKSKLDDNENKYLNYLLSGVALGVAFGFSAWVGGITSLVILSICFIYTIICKKCNFLSWFFSAIVATIVAWPYLAIQFEAGSVASQFPIVVEMYQWSKIQCPIFMAFGFFAIFMVLNFPFTYLTTLFSLKNSYKNFSQSSHTINFISLAIIGSILTSFLLKSVIANNDLGWRAILIAVYGMIIISCNYFPTIRNIYAKSVLIWLLSLSLIQPLQFLHHNIVGGKETALQINSEMYESCAELTPPEARFLNNIYEYSDIGLWEANVIWHLMSQRRSCIGSGDILRALAHNMSHEQREEYMNIVKRIYSNAASETDYSALKSMECTNILVRKSDLLWNHETPELYGWKVLYENSDFRIYAPSND